MGEATDRLSTGRIEAKLSVVNSGRQPVVAIFHGPPGEEFPVEWTVVDENGQTAALGWTWGYRGVIYRQELLPSGGIPQDEGNCLSCNLKIEYPQKTVFDSPYEQGGAKILEVSATIYFTDGSPDARPREMTVLGHVPIVSGP